MIPLHKRMESGMKMFTPEEVLHDLATLPQDYKTADVDRLIKGYIAVNADVSLLREYILTRQELHRIYFFVSLKQMPSAEERMAFIHGNLLLSDWWHTDQLIGFVADLPFGTALAYAKEYVRDPDPYIRRWGYVLFISKLGRGRAGELLPLLHDDESYTVQMAQAWLISDLAVFEPEFVFAYLECCRLKYSITGKAVQKICDSYRIGDVWKMRFRALRPVLKTR